MSMNNAEIFWDKIAERTSPKMGMTAENIIKLTKQYLNKQDEIIDFGCGTGTITNQISFQVRKIDAFDISEKMLAIATEQAKVLFIKNINYTKAEISDIIKLNLKYDCIVSFNVLHYIVEVDHLFKQFNSLLKPNGLLITSTVCLKESVNLARFFMYIFSKIGVIPKTVFYTKGMLENEIKKGGFVIVKSERISKINEYYIVAQKK